MNNITILKLADEFNLNCAPLFPFGRDSAETQAEFRQRLRKLLKYPLIAGQAKLLGEKYNDTMQILPICIDWVNWAQILQSQIDNLHLRLHWEIIKPLLNQSSDYTVYAQLHLLEQDSEYDINVKLSNLYIELHEFKIPVYHQSPPNLLYTLQNHNNWTKAVSFAQHDHLLLASASEDNTVNLQRLGSGAMQDMSFDAHSGINAVAFSPDGHLLAAGSNDSLIHIWNLHNGKEENCLHGHEYTVFSVAFSPDGLMLASGSVDKTVRLWEVQTGRELFILRGHKNWVFSVAFSPDGRFLASGSRDQTVKIWDLRRGTELCTLPNN
jgi:WD40 repeat protein